MRTQLGLKLSDPHISPSVIKEAGVLRGSAVPGGETNMFSSAVNVFITPPAQQKTVRWDVGKDLQLIYLMLIIAEAVKPHVNGFGWTVNSLKEELI